jgi:hypothetical protein
VITRDQVARAMDAALEQLDYEQSEPVRSVGYSALVDALYRQLARLEAPGNAPLRKTHTTGWQVELVPVQYVGGPLDGTVEELTAAQAAKWLTAGDAGRYGPAIHGKRHWHAGAPE